MVHDVQAFMKRDGRGVSRSALEEMRLMAFERMREGESPAAVAASFGLHRGWAYKVRGRAAAGRQALRTRKASGRPCKLSAAQQRQIFGWINGRNPRQYGFDFALWTRQVVRELVQREFGVKLSLATVGGILGRLGLSAQKPLQRAYQRDPPRQSNAGSGRCIRSLPVGPGGRGPTSTSGTNRAFAPMRCRARPGASEATPLWYRYPDSGKA